MSWLRYSSILVLMSIFSFLTTGCPSRKTVKVIGEVKVGGVPAEGARVQFHRIGGEKLPVIPQGEVQADGSFTLSTYEPGDGVPEGEYKVTIVWRERKRILGEIREDGPDKLKGKYADKAKTTLKRHITPSTPEAKFDLKMPK